MDPEAVILQGFQTLCKVGLFDNRHMENSPGACTDHAIIHERATLVSHDNALDPCAPGAAQHHAEIPGMLNLIQREQQRLPRQMLKDR